MFHILAPLAFAGTFVIAYGMAPAGLTGRARRVFAVLGGLPLLVVLYFVLVVIAADGR